MSFFAAKINVNVKQKKNMFPVSLKKKSDYIIVSTWAEKILQNKNQKKYKKIRKR